MTNFESTVLEGRFWLPQDRWRSYGRIDSDNDGIRLHLVDTNLVELADDGPDVPAAIPVLHGEQLGGVPLTLCQVFTTNWTIHGFGGGSGDVVDAEAEVLLKGVHVLSPDDLRVVRATSTLQGLKEFLTGGRIDRGPLNPKRERHARPDTMSVSLGGGVELTLSASRPHSVSFDREQSEIRAYAHWTFPSAVSLAEVERDYASVLQDLVLFATRRQSYVSALSVGLEHDHDQRFSIDVVRAPYPRPRATPDVYALALNLSDLDDPEALVSAWFDLRERIGPVWGLFFAAFDRSESLLDDRLLGLLAFAEGYHRALHDQQPLTQAQEKAALKALKAALNDKKTRKVYAAAMGHANSQTQGQRLEFFTRRAMEVLDDAWYVEVDVFVKRLIHTRNWLIHWGERQSHAVDDTDGMVEMLRSLIVILYVNLLLDLGLSSSMVRKVIGSGWRLEGLPEDVFDVEEDDD